MGSLGENQVGDAAAAAEALAAALRAVAERRDRAAFAEVFAFYAPRAKAYYRGLGADEARAEGLAEEAMLAIWRGAGSLPASADPSGWVFARVRDAGVVGLQGRRRPDFDAGDPALVEGTYKGERAAVEVTAALRRLPGEEVDLLRTLYHAPLAANARAAEPFPAGTRLRLALARLRDLLARRGDR